jgi:hypothetical protein
MAIDYERFIRLYFGGTYSDQFAGVEQFLDEYLIRGALPPIQPGPFVFQVYRRWAAIGRAEGIRDRTTRKVSDRLKDQQINSGYHRLTGRLAFDRITCDVSLKMFLLDWSGGNPYPGFDETKVESLVADLYPEAFLTIRPELLPFHESDFEFLLEIVRLGIPVTKGNIDKLLRVKVAMRAKTAS